MKVFIAPVEGIVHLLLFLGGKVAADSLDGYLFSCGGRVNFMQGPPYYGFSGDDEVYCQGLTGSSYKCGSYSYARGGGDSLLLTLNDEINFISGSFEGRDLQLVDGILVSYMTDYARQVLPCTVQALDWRRLERGPRSVFFACRPQNAVPGQSYEDNSFTFYDTGNVHFQSNLEIVTGNGDTIRRDHHGVYVWDRATGAVKLYAGPQNGRERTTLTGTLGPDGRLFVDGFVQENDYPCQAQSDVAVLPSGSDYPVPANNGGRDDGSNGGSNDGSNGPNNDGNNDGNNGLTTGGNSDRNNGSNNGSNNDGNNGLTTGGSNDGNNGESNNESCCFFLFPIYCLLAQLLVACVHAFHC